MSESSNAALLAELGQARALRVPDPDRLLALGAIDCVVVMGASGAGKSTLVRAIRTAALPAVEVPRRFVTRPQRADDDEEENLHVASDELERRAQHGELGLHWARPMEGARVERYGFAPAAPGMLTVYSGNNALHTNAASVRPPGALAHAFFVGVYAPDPTRAARLWKRSPELWQEARAELAYRLADAAEQVLPQMHVVVENHGELEEAARRETVQLVARLAARLAALSLAVLAVLLVACGHTQPPAPVAASAAAAPELTGVAPFFVAGEQITWDVQLLGMEGGRARMAIGEVGALDGRRVVAAVLEVESSGLLATVKSYKEIVASWVDVESGVPARTDSDTESDGKQLSVHATRTALGAELRVAHGGARASRVVQRLPSPTTHDSVSAILLLRAWKAPVGSRGRYYLLDGQRLWRNEILVEAAESIAVPLGRRQAVRITGVAHALGASLAEDPGSEPRQFSYWFSDDAQRIPLRVVSTTAYGQVEMRATSYVEPAGLRSSAASRSPPTRMGN